jgi:hypothetical protein
VLVPPGQSADFTVTYEPRTAEASEVDVLIHSNDPDEEFSIVHLQGTGLAPVIQLDPWSYDWGAVNIGCEAPLPLKIKNIGNTDLIVTDLTYLTASSELSFDALEAVNGPLPWTIAPGDDVEVSAIYLPTDDLRDEGYLQVSSNDPYQGAAEATQIGQGQLPPLVTETFVQDSGLADLLFIIDDAAAMEQAQARIAASAETLLDSMVDAGMRFHIGVITARSPIFHGAILTEATPDMEDAFISQLPGVGGTGDGQPAEMAWQATRSGADAGPGGAFLRDDALLAMIFISGEPDTSPTDWSIYLSDFQALKTGSDDLQIHAISGDYPDGCDGASAADNAYEMSVATDGLYLSACAINWNPHMEAIAERVQRDFRGCELSQFPDPDSVEVSVDGVPLTEGWVYNNADNNVTFDETPEPGAVITITYLPMPSCPG